MLMRKYLWILILIAGLTSPAESRDYIGWNKPELISRNKVSFLQENDEMIASYPMTLEPADESQFFFALNSWRRFKHSLQEFIISKENDHKFLQYYTPQTSKSSDERHSSYLHPPSVPLRSYFNLSLYSGIDLVANDEDSYYFFYFGSHLSGSIDHKLDFYADWWKGHFAGDLDYAGTSHLIDSWTQTSSDSTQIFLDNITGRMQYRIAPWWKAAIGRGRYEIGNNIGGSIILDDFCNDYGYASTSFNFSAFDLSLIHATLVADSTVSGYKDFPDKYLATHKLNWRPNRKLELFVGEHIIYGDRSIDVNYLLPLSFWRITEHNLSDRDNVLIFAGMNWRAYHGNLCYINLILDELSKSEILKNWWGNKYAVQTGYSHSFSNNNEKRLTFELTAIRPWLYTHKYIHTKFSQDRRSLGFPEGSNLIQFASELDYPILKNLKLNLHTSFTRQGSVGNDFSINYESRDPDLDNDTHWLEGSLSDRYLGSLVIDWSPLAHHRFKIALQAEKTDDEKLQNQILFGYQARY